MPLPSTRPKAGSAHAATNRDWSNRTSNGLGLIDNRCLDPKLVSSEKSDWICAVLSFSLLPAFSCRGAARVSGRQVELHWSELGSFIAARPVKAVLKDGSRLRHRRILCRPRHRPQNDDEQDPARLTAAKAAFFGVACDRAVGLLGVGVIVLAREAAQRYFELPIDLERKRIRTHIMAGLAHARAKLLCSGGNLSLWIARRSRT